MPKMPDRTTLSRLMDGGWIDSRGMWGGVLGIFWGSIKIENAPGSEGESHVQEEDFT
jgi:hypothetical protein